MLTLALAMLNVGKAIARSVHTTTRMPRRSSFAMALSEGMPKVSGSMAVTTITVITAEAITAQASVASWEESSADLDLATNTISNDSKMPRFTVAASFF